jgi:hypothetical protein
MAKHFFEGLRIKRRVKAIPDYAALSNRRLKKIIDAFQRMGFIVKKIKMKSLRFIREDFVIGDIKMSGIVYLDKEDLGDDFHPVLTCEVRDAGELR